MYLDIKQATEPVIISYSLIVHATIALSPKEALSSFPLTSSTSLMCFTTKTDPGFHLPPFSGLSSWKAFLDAETMCAQNMNIIWF